MPQIPTYQRQPVDVGVRYGAGASGVIREQVSANVRLQARLQGGIQQVAALATTKITEETQKQALEDVKAGKIDSKSVALVAKEVYKRTAESSFMADVEVGAKNLGTRLVNEQTAENNYNINSFNTSWNSYIKGTTSGVKDIVVKSNIEAKLSKMGQHFQAQVATLQTKQQRGIQKDNLTAKLDMDTNELKASFGVNNEASLGTMVEIDSTLQALVDSNMIAPNVAKVKRKQIYKDAYLSHQQRNLNAALEQGNAYKFYEKFKKADHQGILDAADIVKFRDDMISQITTDNKAYKAQLEQETNKAEIETKDTIDEFNTQWIAGTLTPTMINDALSNNIISITQHREYQIKANDTGALVDNSNKLLIASTHLLDMTEDEILVSPDFTNKTKTTLIAKRRVEMADESNWLSTQSGREARRRIREAFSIIDGTLMAKLDLNNKSMQEYDNIYRDFFGQVEALPLEQRANKSIEIADKLLNSYKLEKDIKKQERVKEKVDKKKNNEAKVEKDYESSVTGKFMNMLSDKWSSSDLAKILEDVE